MTVSLVAALVHAASLFLQWRGGFISIDDPRQRRATSPAKDLDRRSSTVWDAANILELGGLAIGFAGIGRIPLHAQLVGLVGLMILIVGIVIRWAAIRTLGRFFTGVVMIRPDHQLVRRGLYQYVRHPAYAGTIVAHVGLGMAFASWMSIALSTVPFLVAALYRIPIEEDALRQAFGTAYSNYAKDT